MSNTLKINNKKGFIITIDGPSGQERVQLRGHWQNDSGFIYIDTGAMYRVVAHEMSKRRMSFENEDTLFPVGLFPSDPFSGSERRDSCLL